MVDHIFHISIAVTAAWQCVIDAGGGATAVCEDGRLERAYLSAPFSGLGKLLHTDVAKTYSQKKISSCVSIRAAHARMSTSAAIRTRRAHGPPY